MSNTETVALREDVANQIIDRLDRIEDEIKKMVRRQDSQQKGLDLIDENFSIIEDNIALMRSIEQLLKTHRDHQQNATKDIKNEITEIKDGVDGIPDEIKQQLTNNFDKLIETSLKKSSSRQGKSLFAKLFNRTRGAEGSKRTDAKSN